MGKIEQAFLKTHNTKTILFDKKKDAVERGEKYKEMNEDCEISIFKAMGGENIGRYVLHVSVETPPVVIP